jgi:hypothetical protein
MPDFTSATAKSILPSPLKCPASAIADTVRQAIARRHNGLRVSTVRIQAEKETDQRLIDLPGLDTLPRLHKLVSEPARSRFEPPKHLFPFRHQNTDRRDVWD